ncbi:hypothetical protein CU048_13785 [Beijerinckiaceae bacterium]|nr:hypothetical protein CU048_13785 [Beijerinckiaceae bacterium]
METLETVQTMTAIRPAQDDQDARPKRIRSAVTNGKRSFVVGDGNSQWARRHRDLMHMYISDQGGPDAVSTVAYSLCRLAASLGTEREIIEGKLSMGLAVDLDQFGRIAGHERRVLETLGLERRAKPVNSDSLLVDYFAKPVRPKTSSNE